MPTSRRFGGRSSTIVSPMMTSLALHDEARDDAQQRGLAAAGGAEQRDQFAGLDVERDVVHRERATSVA